MFSILSSTFVSSLVLIINLWAVEPPHVQALPTEVHVSSLQITEKENTLTVGDIIELSVTLPDHLSDVIPSIDEKLREGPVAWAEGRILWWKKDVQNPKKIVFGLTTYKSGVFKIDPIPLIKEGTAVASTEAKELEFVSLGKSEKEPELYPPLIDTLPLWLWVLAVIVGILVLVIAVYLYRRWQKKRRLTQPQIKTPEKIFTPLEELEQVLASLGAKNYIKQNLFKPYYFTISDAAKKFLGRSFEFDAEERTTRELSHELRKHIQDENLVLSWVQIFETMDVVKYTDQLPMITEAEALISQVKSLAQQTYYKSPVARTSVSAGVQQ